MPNRVLSEALRQIPPHVAAQPSAAERVAHALREQIVNGALRSGTRLTEETIGAALGFSRNTIREAFALLIAERLAAREPNRGVFVATPTPDDIRDLYATRQLIEPAAVEHAPGFSDEALGSRSIVDAARAARERGDDTAVAQGNQEFTAPSCGSAGAAALTTSWRGCSPRCGSSSTSWPTTRDSTSPTSTATTPSFVTSSAATGPARAEALRAYLADAEQHLLSELGATRTRDRDR